MTTPKILIQLDTDPQVSTFDGVVAIDAEVDHLFRHGQVEPSNVRELVHGAMFTRGGEALKNTAIFVGGSNVLAGEEVFAAVRDSFFGSVRVSMMIDSGGCNTTATAAVLSAAAHIPLEGTTALVLAATGSVGARISRLLARRGTRVLVASRKLDRAKKTCDQIVSLIPDAKLDAVAITSEAALRSALENVPLVFSAGAAGIQLLQTSLREAADDLRVVIDLNAVPPLGVEGIAVNDRAKTYGQAICYGAIGIGGLKLKIHKAAIRRLFEQNDLLLDAEEIFTIGDALG
ncbi:MAG: methylenetetrahydromethanopterin dehydrogenase [Planctomycetales bacterium]